jgi:hypothetical protein
MGPETHTGTASASPTARGTGTGIALPIVTLLVLVSCGGSGYLGARWAAKDLRTELALRPPVVLFDLAGAVRGVAPDRLPAALARHKRQAERLADAGFLVLDAQAVIAAPPDFHLDTPSSPNDTGDDSP